MTTKPFEEFMSEINSMNIEEALANAKKSIEAFEARDIIKQQQETINRQKAELSRAKDYIELLEIEKQTLKEAKEKAVATAMGVIKRQDAKIERLKAELKEDSRTMKQVLVLLDELKQDIANDITTAKAKAIKEFAESLKDETFKINYCGSVYNVVDIDDIDNLVKEMVGEGNV